MPIVRVEMWTGRTHEQKAQMAKLITDALVNIAKTSADQTIVIFDDVDPANWSQGGVLVSDV